MKTNLTILVKGYILSGMDRNPEFNSAVSGQVIRPFLQDFLYTISDVEVFGFLTIPLRDPDSIRIVIKCTPYNASAKKDFENRFKE